MNFKKDVVIVVVNLICTVVCAILAGCRLSVGKFHIEEVSAELLSTNSLSVIER